MGWGRLLISKVNCLLRGKRCLAAAFSALAFVVVSSVIGPVAFATTSGTENQPTPDDAGDGGLSLNTNALQNAQLNVGGDRSFPITVLLFSPELNDLAARQRHEGLQAQTFRHTIQFSTTASRPTDESALDQVRQSLFRDYEQSDAAAAHSISVRQDSGSGVWVFALSGLGLAAGALMVGGYLGRRRARRRNE